MSWVRWSQICKPKQKGGLGVKDLYMFNVALLTKWRWRVLNGNFSALWWRVVEARYGGEKPWFGNNLNPRAACRTSIWWRDLALLGEGTSVGSNWFSEVTKKRMGNGATVKFWKDKWFGMDSLASLFPSLFESYVEKDVTVAAMGKWTESEWEWVWTYRGAEEVFPGANTVNDNTVIADFVDFLQGVQPISTDEDRWIWVIDIPKGFTVKSCYIWLCNRLMSEASHEDVTVMEACKSLWSNDIPSKVLIFCWRLLLKKLPTRDNLYARGVLPSPHEIRCVFCQEELESVVHLFCSCRVVKEIWRGIFSWLNVQECFYDDLVLLYRGVGDLVKGKVARRVKIIFWAATCYQIWMARNRKIFNNETPTARSIVTSVKYVSWGWFIARKGRNSGLLFSDWFSSPMGCISSL